MNVYSCTGKATCTMEYDRHLICKIRLTFALAFLINGNSNTFACIALSRARTTNREKDYSSGRAIDLLTAILSEIVDRKLGRRQKTTRRAPTFKHNNRGAASVVPHFSANSYHLFDIECSRLSTAPMPMLTHKPVCKQDRARAKPEIS